MTGIGRAVWQTMPWFDATGRLSALKLVTFTGTCLPAIWMLTEFSSGRWDFPAPYVYLIYHSGLWCTYLLLACLAVTPVRRLTGMGRLAQLRRLLGVASFAYCLLHIVAWFGLRFWDWVALAAELGGRTTLWVATLSALLLLALAVTSLDSLIRLMRKRWKQLHSLVYIAAFLAVLHYLMSPGSIQGSPFLMAGVFFWLMGWRVLERQQLGTEPTALLWLGLVSVLVAMLLQPLWLMTFQAERSTQTPLAAILDNFNADIWIYLGVPPMWILLAWTLFTVSISGLRQRKTLPKPIS